MTRSIPTVIGDFTGRFNQHGLVELTFPAGRSSGKTEGDVPVPANVRQWVKLTQTALNAILAGQTPRELPLLDLSAGTEFQQAVWRELAKIPTGQTRSYGEIAQRIGRPQAVRAVGGACGANPIPVLIPCHRVLAASGKIGGFSGGLERKRELLDREGVSIRE